MRPKANAAPPVALPSETTPVATLPAYVPLSAPYSAEEIADMRPVIRPGLAAPLPVTVASPSVGPSPDASSTLLGRPQSHSVKKRKRRDNDQ